MNRWPTWIGSNVPPRRPTRTPLSVSFQQSLPPASPASTSDLSLALNDPLDRGQPLPAHRAASMQLLRADTPLRPETEFKAIRKTGRDIHINHGSVHPSLEAPRRTV